MASRSVRVGTSAPKGVTAPGARPQMVLGSRPATMRSPPIPNPMTGSGRIAPGPPNNTNYGKPGVTPNPLGSLGVGG